MHDNYTKFYFNNFDSSAFKVLVTNNHDLEMNLSPNFSDKFNTPTYSNITFHEGTTVSNQEFVVKCVAINVTKQEWRAITEWLSPFAIGPLTFLWNRNHYYITKVSKAPNGEMWVKNKVDSVVGETYNITFQVTFTTVEDWAALGQPATITAIGKTNLNKCENFKNEYHVPFISVNNKKRGNYYYNVGWREVNKDTGSITCYYMDSDTTTVITIGDGTITFKSTDNSSSATEETETSYDTSYWLYFGPNCYVETSNSWTPSNFLIANPGAHDMYPNIFYHGSQLTMTQNNEVFLNLQTFDKTEYEYSLFNGRNGFITSNGEFIQMNSNFDQSVTVSKGLTIPSGRPELLKLIHDTTEEGDWVSLTFKTTKPIVYSRNNGWVVTFFHEWPVESNIFNLDPYSEKKYYEEEFAACVLYSPVIEWDADQYTITFKYLKGTETMLNEFEFIDSQYVYCSICDAISIDYSGPGNDNTVTFDVQTRDVI